MSEAITLGWVLSYTPLTGLMTMVQESLVNVVSKENLKHHTEHEYLGPVYKDGDVCKIKHLEHITIKLKKYVGSCGYLDSTPGSSGRSLNQRMFDILSNCHGVMYCARRLCDDALSCITNVDLSRRAQLLFASAPLAPEEVYSGIADEISCAIIERQGWYVTLVIERQKWDVRVDVGILAGVTLHEW